jgi:hypothetical protein
VPKISARAVAQEQQAPLAGDLVGNGRVEPLALGALRS